jgi:Tfp pilus assembly protein PilF
MARLEALKSLVQQDPANERIRFMLCMEYASTGDYAGALSELDELISRHPNYAAAYFQAGRVSETVENTAAARDYYTRGIEAAQHAGDRHAAAEMSEALEALG